MERLGFIGVGAMGGALARKLTREGFALAVCDANPANVEPFRAAGARGYNSIVEHFEQFARAVAKG